MERPPTEQHPTEPPSTEQPSTEQEDSEHEEKRSAVVELPLSPVGEPLVTEDLLATMEKSVDPGSSCAADIVTEETAVEGGEGNLHCLYM